jgi:hypothetical protein
MSQHLEVRPLDRTVGSIRRFLKVSYRVYHEDPLWVAPLLMDLEKVFTDANPLFEHARMQLWVATRDGQDVGRIAGVIDDTHNKIHKANAAFFGFFECVNDPEVSRALFRTMFEWARREGMHEVLGPMNPTSNDECGLLVKGFDSSPVFMMTYNPEYYISLVEREGFRKAKDLLAYDIDLARIPLDRLARIGEKVKQRNPGIRFRAVTKKTLAQDVVKVKEVYNAAWADNWGFVPMTDPEVDFMAKRLGPLLMEGLVWLAETESETAGFLLALPDYNVALKPLNGRLLTPAILGFLPYVLGWKCPKRTRVLTLGVKDRYRSKGLESAMLIEGLKVGFNAGTTHSEASWILEDNVMMCRLLETIGGVPYKTYRLYTADLK